MGRADQDIGVRVLITGIGARCALGEDRIALWDGIERGGTGISAVTRFDVTPFDAGLAALVRSGDRSGREAERMLAYARASAAEALDHAGITDYGNVALVLGTCNGVPLGSEIHGIGTAVVRAMRLGGPAIIVSTACASSAHALAMGAELVRRGIADMVLAGGADTVSREVFAGFHSLGLLSRTACAPFSTVEGTTLGEGAAFMVLESEASVEQRSVTPVAEVMGYGMSADAFHDTTPDASGAGLARALGVALQDAGAPPESIGYYNAHGTGTVSNDAAEWRAVRRAFGPAATRMPISASKSFLGHTLGACGALEAVVTLMAMEHDMVPPTIGLVEPRRGSPTDLVIGSRPRPHSTRKAVSGSLGFGGLNAALVFGKSNGTRRILGRAPRPVGLSGVGIANDHHEIGRFVPRTELRGTDRYARLLSGAVGKAVMQGGFRFRTPACENIGVFVGQTRASRDTVDAFDRSLRERGPANASASAFTRLLSSYATGACCRLLGLMGPAISLSTGPNSGLAALVLAAEYLASRDDVDSMVAAAVEEAGEGMSDVIGAAGVLLAPAGEGTSILLRGWAIAKDRGTAERRALRQGSCRSEQLGRTVACRPNTILGLGSAIETIDEMREARDDPVLMVGEGELATFAVLFQHVTTG